MSSDDVHDVITAKQIRLVDDQGNTRALLYTDKESGSSFHLFGENGTSQVALSVDAAGHPHVELFLGQEGHLGNPRIALGASEEGANIIVFNKKGEIGFRLAVFDDQPAVAWLANEDGQPSPIQVKPANLNRPQSPAAPGQPADPEE